MKDRRLHAFCDVGAVHRRPRIFRCRREADLVVHDDVYRAANVITSKLGQVQGFCNNALARKRRIAVDEY